MIRVFPVALEGAPHFSNDFGAQKTEGAHKHQGIDIFAAEGAPVLAVDDGALRFAEDPVGGHAFYLAADDRTTYYGAHLSRYEGAARRVQAGEVIAYVGHTGNAAHTSPHLHFEAHPSGGVAVNPFRALSDVPAVSAAEAILRARPPMPVASDPLPPLPVTRGPVPPIPHDEAPRRRGGGAFGAVLALLGGAFALSRGRRRYA